MKPETFSKETHKYEIIMECSWKTSSNCWKTWSKFEDQPIADGGISHGICKPCLEILLEEEKNRHEKNKE